MTSDSRSDLPPTAVDLGPAAAPPTSLRTVLAGLGAVHPGEWLALLRADQHKRWERGEHILAEVYLDQLPELRDDAEAAVDLIYSEVLLREERGERPQAEEYLHRFPQHQARLERQFALHEVLAASRLVEEAVRSTVVYGPQNDLAGARGAAGATSSAEPCVDRPDLAAEFPRGESTLSYPGPAAVHNSIHFQEERDGKGPPSVGVIGEGQTLDRFRLQKLLGEGGFAQVYLAYDPALDRQVAIKVPRQQSVRANLLRREALVAAKLRHPGIVQIYEIGPSAAAGVQSRDERVYVVMQYIEGTNLAQRLEKERVSLDDAVDLMLAVAEALAFAHGQGVLHRDLKPHNILLDADNHPYVADFGLAIREETLDRHVGEGCGTPGYMSPEQIVGRSLTPASDIWSLGIILYELLVGQRPFGGHPLEVLRRVGKEDPIAPRQLDSAVPDALEQICLKCLAREPAARYQSAEELVTALRKWKTYRAAGPSEGEIQEAEQYHKQAFAALDRGELSTAIERLKDVVRLNPDSANDHYLLGLSYLMADYNVQLAVVPLRMATELDRDHHAANFLLGNLYFEVGALHLAAACADQALAIKPSNQTYRAFQKRVRDRLGSADSKEALKSQDIKYDLDPARRLHLSDVADAAFHAEKTSQLTLLSWTELHFPWRLIRRSPSLGSVLVASSLYGVVMLTLLNSDDITWTVRFTVMGASIGLALYFPFLIARLLEHTYVRLLPAINMPEEVFRRFFIRQSAFLVGGTCALREARDKPSFWLSWRYNRPQLLIAASIFPALLAVQIICGNEPLWPLTWPRFGYFTIGVLQTYLICWAWPLAVLMPRFLPRFYNIPVRYFLGMPAESSLGSVGAFYVRLGWMTVVVYFVFLLQHYVFRTYQTVPIVSVVYVALGICWIIAIAIVTQYQLYRLLSRFKARKILEYSYHMESTFERVMKRPTEQGFHELAAHQQFMKSLHSMSARGLSREDRASFLLIVAILLGLTAIYAYLVFNGIWLLA
jgi:tRNA A-37 threonylcarbamoyl transferase component Bud32